MTLPVAAHWYSREDISPGVTLISEPHVNVLLRANLWHVRGEKFDLLIDAGNGVAPLRAAFPDLLGDERTVLVLTHTHVDHMGAAHEFAERWVHPIEAAALASPATGSLHAAEWDPAFRDMFLRAGYPALPEVLIDALPDAGYEPASYALRGAAPTQLLEHGETIDLGDRVMEVLHVPGHSPGSIALWDAANRVLFAGDVVYDGPLLYEGEGMSVTDYRESFQRLRALPVEIVHAGHDPSFGRARLNAIIDAYETKWDGL